MFALVSRGLRKGLSYLLSAVKTKRHVRLLYLALDGPMHYRISTFSTSLSMSDPSSRTALHASLYLLKALIEFVIRW